MNVNAGIVDQQVRGLATKRKTELEHQLGKPLDEQRLNSAAFVLLCAKYMLDLNDEEVIALITEGGEDFGVDAIYVGDIADYQFDVVIFQGKYSHSDLTGGRNFPQSGVEKAVQAVRTLFDPSADVQLNPRLRAQVDEIRSLIADGNFPRVQVFLCNNGKRWTDTAQQVIDNARFGKTARFDYVNSDTLINHIQKTERINDQIQFVGRAFSEDVQFVRVFVGKVAVTELARLVDKHGEQLLERNIRRFLGLRANRVNEAIETTLKDSQDRPNFFFYNNGLTMICERFVFNALQTENHKVRVEGLQIINGGQTTMTTADVLQKDRNQGGAPTHFDDAHVLVRLYQVTDGEGPDPHRITYAVNSQNPVDLRDLRANDAEQMRLETDMKALGYTYRRKRGSDSGFASTEISSATAAEAVLSVWRRKPQQAKFRSGEHFGKLYSEIFTKDLNGTQVVLAVLLFRIAENNRKRPPVGAPELVRYASCFAAMLMGDYLLGDVGLVRPSDLNHRKFTQAAKLVQEKGDQYFSHAIATLQDAVAKLYGGQNIGLQRLSATFRRADLHDYLTRPV